LVDAVYDGIRHWIALVEGRPDKLDAWHGSAHRFAIFSTDHIGSGEGHQAYVIFNGKDVKILSMEKTPPNS
jgi:hypothetical protein